MYHTLAVFVNFLSSWQAYVIELFLNFRLFLNLRIQRIWIGLSCLKCSQNSFWQVAGWKLKRWLPVKNFFLSITYKSKRTKEEKKTKKKQKTEEKRRRSTDNYSSPAGFFTVSLRVREFSASRRPFITCNLMFILVKATECGCRGWTNSSQPVVTTPSYLTYVGLQRVVLSPLMSPPFHTCAF